MDIDIQKKKIFKRIEKIHNLEHSIKLVQLANVFFIVVCIFTKYYH